MGRQPHVLVIPYPAQGHVGPLMKLSTKLAEQGIKVTFVITEHFQAKIKASIAEKSENLRAITLVSIPDGLELDGEDRKDPQKFRQSMLRVMPGCLKNLIEKINQSNDCEQIRCVISDISIGGWALEVAEHMGIAKAAVIPYGPRILAFGFHIPKLIEAGIVDTNGNATNDEFILLPEEILAWKRDEYPWTVKGAPNIQKFFFELSTDVNQSVKISNWVLSNSVYELDSAICNLIPNILSIGPLLTSNHSEQSAFNLWPEDLTCLSWLDKQAKGSVIYVAFGSVAMLNQQQFEELALGLESLNQPFLWVVRPDLMDISCAKFPDGFTERISDHGKIVEWAPQEKVLSHSSVACFLSHCGWNSTMEGLSMGVPFICWPYFADQYENRNYICNVWKIGLQLSPDGNGIITREEIRRKVKTLLNDDDGIKANSWKLKEIAKNSLVEGGSSFISFESFITEIKVLGS